VSVYVDPMFNHNSPTAPRCFRNKQSCHMYADTLPELHRMADAIGMKREWFQNHRVFPHYDLVAARREAAIRLGAIEHTRAQMALFVRPRPEVRNG
jgi:hypothetical protein